MIVAVRRLHITLLELLVVIAILALISGIVAVNINKALVDQHFRTETSVIVDELRLAQDLMLILDTDVQVMFAEDNKRDGINYWIETETVLPKHIQREILRKHTKLKTIRGVFFHEEMRQEEEEGKLALKFLSKGAVMSKGIIKLSTSDDEHETKGVLESYICLPGYPKPIFSTDSLEVAETACNPIANADFDMRLTQDTVEKIPESAKKSEERQNVAPKKEEEKEASNKKRTNSSKTTPQSGER